MTIGGLCGGKGYLRCALQRGCCGGRDGGGGRCGGPFSRVVGWKRIGMGSKYVVVDGTVGQRLWL